MSQWEYTTTPPGSVSPAALTSSAPGHTTPAALTTIAPAGTTPPALSSVAPDSTTTAQLTTYPPGVGVTDETPTPLPQMPSAFTPAFVELTGSAAALDQLNAAALDIGKILQGTVDGQLKSYRVSAGTDAEDLPGIVRPANFNAVTNACIFVQC